MLLSSFCPILSSPLVHSFVFAPVLIILACTLKLEEVCMETSVFCKILLHVSTPLVSFKSDHIVLPKVTDTPKVEITNCFIHRIQLKTVKSPKVTWRFWFLSPLRAQVITLTSELQEILVKRGARNIFLVEGYVGEKLILIKLKVGVVT